VDKISYALRRVKTNKSTIVLGDLNAHVGNDVGVWRVRLADMVILTMMIRDDACCNCAITTHYAS